LEICFRDESLTIFSDSVALHVMQKSTRFLFSTIALLTGFAASAAVRLPAIFSDNVVLQRRTPVRVWGWADDGEKVTVKFRGQKRSTVAHDGKWCVKLAPMEAGESDILEVTGQNSIALATNVAVGEVWICSGQSNMEFPLERADGAASDIASSDNQEIRLFMVPNVKSDEILRDSKTNWMICSPKTTPTFSAVGYYFGRSLQRHFNVPVGLIESDWGGSPAEVWTSEYALEKNPRYKKEILETYPAKRDAFQAALDKYNAAKGKKGRAPRAPWKPAELYNGMIAPLIPFTIKGVIWYQGEANASRAEQYRTLFPDMIRSWRSDWCEGNFPFLAVQLAPYKPIQKEPGESDWAELREAQLHATKVLPNVGIAVITGLGEEHNIHPTKKEPVGERLALAARHIAYGEDIVYSGPIFKKMKVKGDKAILSFDHVGSGLEARDGALKGFAICGADKKFVWANAEIDGDKVIVSSPEVQKPVAVRYGWADYPVVNLWNKDGLPASPFRTDDFPMITAGK
jgi:sialate O-acetylesterase